MRDEQLRAWRRHHTEPFILGSQGQPVQNPAFGEAMTLEKAIVTLEDRLGLSPKARATLGLKLGEARMSMERLNAMADKVGQDDDDAIELAELVDELG